MENLNNFRAVVLDVILSDHETRGRPAASTDQRPILIDGLESLILDTDAIHEHGRWLFGQDRAGRHRSILSEARLRDVLDGGLAVLDDRELAELTLNPISLMDIADWVEELLPESWLERVERSAEDLVRRHGVSFEPIGVPDLDRSRGPASERDLLAIGSLPVDDGSPPTQHWDFTLSATDGRWEPAAMAESQGEATIRIERDESTGALSVQPEGFIEVGHFVRVEVAWVAANGDLRAVGRVEDDFSPVLLEPTNPAPPASGDRLEITRTRRSSASSPGWTVHVVVAFP